jgi:hypothetical protein
MSAARRRHSRLRDSQRSARVAAGHPSRRWAPSGTCDRSFDEPARRRRSGWSVPGGPGRGLHRPRGQAGIAGARANALPSASKSARAIAEHLVREVVGSGVSQLVRLEPAVLAVWGLSDEVTADGWSESDAPGRRARAQIVLDVVSNAGHRVRDGWRSSLATVPFAWNPRKLGIHRESAREMPTLKTRLMDCSRW